MDQAHELRQLVRFHESDRAAERPRLVGFVGGHPGTSASELAGRLATDLTSLGHHCEIVEEPPAADWTAGPVPRPEVDFRLFSRSTTAGDSDWSAWKQVERVYLVGGCETNQVLATYSTLKLLDERGLRGPAGLIVEGAQGRGEATEVAARLEQVCQRFLSRPLPLVAWLPKSDVDSITGDVTSETSRVLARQTRWAVLAILSQLAEGPPAERKRGPRLAVA